MKPANPKPMSNMNRTNIESWSIRLGALQMVILLGIVTGSMVCAFYLGYSSGQNVGLEQALASSATSLAKLPIMPPLAESGDSGVSDEMTSEVYAKLNTDKLSEERNAHEDRLHMLGSGKKGEKTVEGLSPLQEAEIHEPLAPPSSARGVKANQEMADVSQRSDKKNLNGKGQTLGDIFQAEQRERAAAQGSELGRQKDAIKQAGSNVHQEEEDRRISDAVAKAVSQNEGIQEASPLVEEEVPAPAPVTRKKEKEEPRNKVNRAGEEVPPSAVKAKEVPVKQKPVPSMTESSSGVSRGWYAQVGARTTLADANAFAKTLKGSGFPVTIEKTEVKGVQYFRLLVGPESSKETGERLLNQLKREKYIKNEPFLRSVK